MSGSLGVGLTISLFGFTMDEKKNCPRLKQKMEKNQERKVKKGGKMDKENKHQTGNNRRKLSVAAVTV